MGFGAIAGLAGAAISAGVSAAGSAGLFGGGGPNLGEYSSTLNKAANSYLLPFANNQNYWNIDPTAMATQSIQYGLQMAPAINQANMVQLQSLLNQAVPGYQNIVGQMSANTKQLLSGQVPTDVQQQIQRSGAFQGLMTGMGAGGGGAALAGNLASATSLGLTSLNLQNTGFTQASNLLQLGRNVLSPQQVNPLSLLPLSDLINASEWSKSAQFQANEAAYNAKAAAAAARVGTTSPNVGAGISSSLNTFLGQMGQKNPSSGYTGWQTLANLFGGGGGGGGGGGLIDLSDLSQGTSFGY
jgi:hypothetical protein